MYNARRAWPQASAVCCVCGALRCLRGVVALLPSAVIFLMKINLVQWFDKGDLSHVFMAIGVYIYYIGITKINSEKAPFNLSVNR